MCSSAVKTSIVQMSFVLVCTVLGAALQDMLPSFGGTKAPVLLVLALHWTFAQHENEVRNRIFSRARLYGARWLLAAFFTGVFEDALGGLPMGCATTFTVLACLAARVQREAMRDFAPAVRGLMVAMLAAPFYELWLAVWGVTGHGTLLLVRFFASALPAAVTGLAVFAWMPVLERHVGFEGPERAGRNT